MSNILWYIIDIISATWLRIFLKNPQRCCKNSKVYLNSNSKYEKFEITNHPAYDREPFPFSPFPYPNMKRLWASFYINGKTDVVLVWFAFWDFHSVVPDGAKTTYTHSKYSMCKKKRKLSKHTLTATVSKKTDKCCITSIYRAFLSITNAYIRWGRIAKSPEREILKHVYFIHLTCYDLYNQSLL